MDGCSKPRAISATPAITSTIPAHHKHAYYIVANVDLSGFTNREREFVATLCRYHRKAMPSPAHPEYQALAGGESAAADCC